MYRGCVAATVFLVWHPRFCEKVLLILSPPNVARNSDGWIRASWSGDKMTPISMSHREHCSYRLSPLQNSENQQKCTIGYPISLQKQSFKMAAVIETSWSVTNTKMLISFNKGNRQLWDKEHKDYGKKNAQKKPLTPLLAKLEKSKAPQTLEEVCYKVITYCYIPSDVLHFFSLILRLDECRMGLNYWR